MINLEYFNVKIEKVKETNGIVIRGEVSNRTDVNYSTIALRILLFVKNIAIANVIVLISGLTAGATKEFEKGVEDLEYDKIAKDITRYEIYTESAY